MHLLQGPISHHGKRDAPVVMLGLDIFGETANCFELKFVKDESVSFRKEKSVKLLKRESGKKHGSEKRNYLKNTKVFSNPRV